MVLLQMDYYSQVLCRMTELAVILPDRVGVGMDGALPSEGDYPVLWLLHPGAGDAFDFPRFSGIERYAEKYGLAVVMPSAGPSRFNNMIGHVGDYFDFISQELPAAMRGIFPKLSADRRRNFIAGFSMGGGGAITLGIRRPDLYSAIGIISSGSIIPLEDLRTTNGKPPAPRGSEGPSLSEMHYGMNTSEELIGGEWDVLAVSKRNIEDGKPCPRIFCAVGLSDHAYVVDKTLRDHFWALPGRPYAFDFFEEEGAHSWDFCDKWLASFVDWLFEMEKGAK